MADGSVMIAMIGATKGSFGSVGSTCSTSCGAAPTQEHSSDACPSHGKAMAGGLLSPSTPFLARKNVSGREGLAPPKNDPHAPIDTPTPASCASPLAHHA